MVLVATLDSSACLTKLSNLKIIFLFKPRSSPRAYQMGQLLNNSDLQQLSPKSNADVHKH